MLIFGQKFCFLAPTIFAIPQTSWYYYKYLFLLVGSSIVGNETIDGNQENHDKKSRQDADSQCLPKQE